MLPLLAQIEELVQTPVSGTSRRPLPRDWIGKNLAGQDFSGLSVRGQFLLATNLSNSRLRGVNFLGADLRDCQLAGADLTDALFLTQAQVNAAQGNAKTRLPERLLRPSHWAYINYCPKEVRLFSKDNASYYRDRCSVLFLMRFPQARHKPAFLPLWSGNRVSFVSDSAKKRAFSCRSRMKRGRSRYLEIVRTSSLELLSVVFHKRTGAAVFDGGIGPFAVCLHFRQFSTLNGSNAAS